MSAHLELENTLRENYEINIELFKQYTPELFIKLRDSKDESYSLEITDHGLNIMHNGTPNIPS